MYRSYDPEQLQMKRSTLRRLPSFIVSATFALLPVQPAQAQSTQERSVEQYLCKDVMRESGADRDVVIAFLHGFLLGKSGLSSFNVDTLRKQSNQFIETCLERPGDNALKAMITVKN